MNSTGNWTCLTCGNSRTFVLPNNIEIDAIHKQLQEHHDRLFPDCNCEDGLAIEISVDRNSISGKEYQRRI